MAASAEVAPGEPGTPRQRDGWLNWDFLCCRPNEAGSSLGISKVSDFKRCGLPLRPRGWKMGSVLVEATLAAENSPAGSLTGQEDSKCFR